MRVEVFNGAPLIWYKKDWRRVDEWLKHLKPVRNGSDIDQQTRWWAHNGKIFRLFDLPVEIRQQIYAHTIGSKIEIKSIRRSCFATQGTTFGIPYMGMLLSSVRLYKEASYPLFSLTTYYADSSVASDMLFFNKHRFAIIKHLEFDFNHCDMFRFSGFQINTTFTVQPMQHAEKLKNMTQLRSLMLKIAEASHVTAVNWLDGACQKTVVDWIMESAAPFVLRHNLSWTGDVKPANLIKWGWLVKEEREKMKKWRECTNGSVEDYYKMMDDEDDGGVLLDEGLREEKSKPRVVEREYPPPCRCTVPCFPDEEDESD